MENGNKFLYGIRISYVLHKSQKTAVISGCKCESLEDDSLEECDTVKDEGLHV